MIKILLVSEDKDKFAGLITDAIQEGFESDWAESAQAGFSKMETGIHDVVIVEDPLPDMDGRPFVEKLVMKNPMISCVVSSDMDHKEFHEVYEGLGVLMQFPPEPTAEHMQKLKAHLDNIARISKSISKPERLK